MDEGVRGQVAIAPHEPFLAAAQGGPFDGGEVDDTGHGAVGGAEFQREHGLHKVDVPLDEVQELGAIAFHDHIVVDVADLPRRVEQLQMDEIDRPHRAVAGVVRGGLLHKLDANVRAADLQRGCT